MNQHDLGEMVSVYWDLEYEKKIANDLEKKLKYFKVLMQELEKAF